MRFIVYDNLDTQLGELSTNDVFACIRREEINGEHSLEITTTQVLEKGQRIVYKDGRGYWREYVVSGIDEEHSAGRTILGTYYCVWSLQIDLQGVTVSKMPGVQNPVAARLALVDALSEQTRWTIGNVTQNTTAGASMYDMSAWKAIGVLVDNWGGEVSTSITVDVNGYVVTRAVNLLAHEGSQEANRRFDFGHDLKSVKRSIPDGPLYCRISPRGKGEQTESGGYGRKIRINEDDPSQPDWLEYAPMVEIAKLSDGNGGYQYPTVIVENSDCETAAELRTWAQGILAETLTPKVTYEVDVLQAAREGIDLQGVSLGDAVEIVDRKFGADGLRITGRAIAVEVDEITGRSDSLEIGAFAEKLASKFTDDGRLALETVNALQANMSTAAYIESLVDRINAEINATGGYTYIVPGNGILTFDVAVNDPLNPVEASQVVEVKGGTIRIANSKDAQGQWEWKTVFTSGHIAANLVTAANITAGYVSADVIKGGTLIVYDTSAETDVIFKADVTNHATDIGGFTVSGNSLSSDYVSLSNRSVNLLRNGNVVGSIFAFDTSNVMKIEAPSLHLDTSNYFAINYKHESSGSTVYDGLVAIWPQRNYMRFYPDIGYAKFTIGTEIKESTDRTSPNKIGPFIVKSDGLTNYNRTGLLDNTPGLFFAPNGISYYGTAADSSDNYTYGILQDIGVSVGVGTSDRARLRKEELTFLNSSGSQNLKLNATTGYLQFLTNGTNHAYLLCSSITGAGRVLRMGASAGIVLTGGIWTGSYTALDGSGTYKKGITKDIYYQDHNGNNKWLEFTNGILTDAG